MKSLPFYALILLCLLTSWVGGISDWPQSLGVVLLVSVGFFCERRGIVHHKLNLSLALLLWAALTGYSLLKGGGPQTWILSFSLNIILTLLGYRALSHRRFPERMQVVLLSLLPLAVIGFVFEATIYLPLLFAYFVVVFWFMSVQSVCAPTTGSLAVIVGEGQVWDEGGVSHPPQHTFWRSAIGIALIVFLASSALFLGLPRMGRSAHTPVGQGGQPQGMFPDVSLDRTGDIDLPQTLLFTANIPPRDGGIYWRIEVQEAFDGVRWRSTRPGQDKTPPPKDARLTTHRVEFVRDWRDWRVPTPANTHAVRWVPEPGGDVAELLTPDLAPQFYVTAAHVWHRWGWRRGVPLIAYDMDIADKPVREVYMNFDASLIWPGPRAHQTHPELVEFAQRITEGAQTNRQRAALVQNYLQENYRYSLSRPERQGSAVEDFLFLQRFGHCEVFSTTMAVLLAQLDVPVRNVAGFLSTEFRDGKNYVRAAHAHSWVEVYDTQQQLWIVHDPTPPGSQSFEVGWWIRIDDWFSGYRARTLYTWIKRHTTTLAALAGLLVTLLALRRGLRLISSMRAKQARLAILISVAAAIVTLLLANLGNILTGMGILALAGFVLVTAMAARYWINKPAKRHWIDAFRQLQALCLQHPSTQCYASASLETLWNTQYPPELSGLRDFNLAYIRQRYAEPFLPATTWRQRAQNARHLALAFKNAQIAILQHQHAKHKDTPQ
ncbi:MAG: transglutaminaseTgpA domain-containing protein [Proteobacteria bacterium]|nr:transglutaminaseTgpA domain-containing protein [Pseudomonadota bacterium]